MFGGGPGAWAQDPWDGWWGEDPPFHTPVFVITHHAREPLEKQGATTFFFVTDGIESAFEQAMQAANGKDVSLGGGADVAVGEAADRLSPSWASRRARPERDRHPNHRRRRVRGWCDRQQERHPHCDGEHLRL